MTEFEPLRWNLGLASVELLKANQVSSNKLTQILTLIRKKSKLALPYPPKFEREKERIKNSKSLCQHPTITLKSKCI